MMMVTILKYLLQDLWEGQMTIKIWQKKRGFEMTKKQLKKWNLKYHKLILGKPTYDFVVDDKAYGYNSNWSNKLLKILKDKN